MRILAWGTYDLGKPRVRILLNGLRLNGVELIECHANVWGGIEDKSQLNGWRRWLAAIFRWLFSYPRLIWCYLRAPAHDMVLVPYLGHLDVLLIWPFARLRRTLVVWDAFISFYNTVVEDRRLVGPRHPLAKLLQGLEWLATRAADRVVLDTMAHADYFRTRYGLAAEKTAAVLVGAETERFDPLKPLGRKPKGEPITILFYGQFIPLHGIDVIVRAARQLDDGRVRWVLIGKGQEEARICGMLDERPVRHLEWIPWVPYDELIEWIGRADICLGVFRGSEKAAMVIPNKVFQVIAAGRPLITRDSAAICELLSEDEPGVYLVSPEDENGIVEAVERFISERGSLVGVELYLKLRPLILARGVGASFVELNSSWFGRERG